MSWAIALSSRPSSTARFDCSARLSAYAPAGSSAAITPTSAAREPVKAIQASLTKRFSSSTTLRAAWISASAAVIAFSRSGRTTKTVIAKIDAATKK